MPFQPGANLYGVGIGSRPENVEVPHIDTRAPAATDFLYPLGKHWINTASDTEYTLTSLHTVLGVTTATWTSSGTNTGPLNTLSDDASVTVAPVANNIQLAGTAGQIATTAGTGVITFSFPSAVTMPGSLAVTTSATVGTTLGVTGTTTLAALNQVGTTHINISGAATTVIGTGGTGAVQIGNATGNTAVTGSLTASTTLTATLGAITATNGNLVLGTSGNKILSTSVATTTTAGANSFGSVTLASGTATVATSSVTTNSLILIWRQGVGASTALGELSVGTIVNATSFVVYAATVGTPGTPLATDASSVGWMIVN